MTGLDADDQRMKRTTHRPVQGIIAVQKTEISKIRSGREGMKGYAPQLKKTGGRINSNAGSRRQFIA